MQIFSEVKILVKQEKHYTAKILSKLAVIEKEKLYSDLKYSSLHKYIVKELKYSDAEATIRVNAVLRLILKSASVKKQIESGTLTLTNAAEANKLLRAKSSPVLIEKVIAKAATSSTRQFKDFVAREFKRERREVLVLKEYMLAKFDRVRKIYGELSTMEILEILLEEKLKSPVMVRSARPGEIRNSRHIPKSVKAKVYTGECRNCGVRHGLEYDHQIKFSHGGCNSSQNIQMLCRNCNQRKEILMRQSNLFN